MDHKKTSAEKTGAEEIKRSTRLIQMVREIRSQKHQTLDNILKLFNISKTQFYEDKKEMKKMGFDFNYHRTRGFEITEDKVTPLTDFSISDRLILMFALEYLHSAGEGHLAAQAVEVGRKLAGGLDEPFRKHLLEQFDLQVTRQRFGVQPAILAGLQEAISQGRRIRILYQRSEDWTTSWREIDPRRIYIRLRHLYLYARTADENPPQWKVFRMNRIQELQPTGMSIAIRPGDDDGFQSRMKNAFIAVIGDEVQSISIRFSGSASHYVKEEQWHHSQQISEQPDGSIIFTVTVADPAEVIRWARQWGSEAQLVKPK